MSDDYKLHPFEDGAPTFRFHATEFKREAVGYLYLAIPDMAFVRNFIVYDCEQEGFLFSRPANSPAPQGDSELVDRGQVVGFSSSIELDEYVGAVPDDFSLVTDLTTWWVVLRDHHHPGQRHFIERVDSVEDLRDWYQAIRTLEGE